MPEAAAERALEGLAATEGLLADVVGHGPRAVTRPAGQTLAAGGKRLRPDRKSVV